MGTKDMNEKYEALNRFKKCCIEFLKVFPKFMEGLLDAIGDNYFYLEKYEDAVLCYDLAIRSNTEISDTYFYKGYALMQLGKHSDALQCFMKDLKETPKSPNTLYNIACCLSELGKPQESIKYLQLAIKHDPSCKEDAMNDSSFENFRHLDEFNQIFN